MQVRELGHAREASLDSLTRPSQRKSINRFSTGRLRVVPPVLALFATLAGCAGSGHGPVPNGSLALVPTTDTTHLSPGQTGTLSFTLTSGGLPLPGQAVAYTITNPTDAQGATLDAARAVTDALGTSFISVRAGLETEFLVHATVGSATADALVVVAAGDTGNLEVAPFFAPAGQASKRAATIEILLLPRTACRDIVGRPLPDEDLVRAPYSLPGTGGVAIFRVINRSDVSAILGRAFDAHGAIVAAGCMDVSGYSLLPDNVVRVALRLDDAVPDPIGTFNITSWLSFSPPLTAASVVAAPWRDLADCPLDPAQLWLDCTIDALSPSSPADPLDCVPATAPGGEGALGDALLARRGVPILDRAGNDSGCRGATDTGGAASLDAVLMGMYGSPLPSALAVLPAIADDAAHILDGLTLKSSLELTSRGAPSTFLATHTLVTALLGPGEDQVPIELQALGLPLLTAHTTAAIADGLLVIDSHAFTLHLGSVARTALSKLALERRGLPGDATGLVTLLALLARSNDGATGGCAAMDATLCAAVGSPAGCLMAACSAGLSALAGRLDGAFSAADGAGVDLVLEGSAPPLDVHSMGVAARLGSTTSPPQQAAWSVELRTSLGRRSISANFEGVRTDPHF
jgi:hypothetical protein